MRWLVNYIRSMFCKHDWEMIFYTRVETDMGESYLTKTYRCKKCGYSRKYKSL